MTSPRSFSLKRITDLSGQGIKSVDLSEDIAHSTTIILDNNELSNFKPLSSCAKLQKLSLVNNHILRIDGLASLSRLQVLNIADNKIEKIEGLSNLAQLEWLNLSGNEIKVIGNLKSNILLKHLDLSRNSISELGDLSSLVHLKTFFIQGNKLKTLRDIPAHLPPSISTMSLADNQLEDLTEMQLLCSLPFLENLSIMGNPCLSGKEVGEYIDYRPYVVCCCKNLMNLDGVTVTQANKHSAKVLDAEGHLKMLHPGEHSKLTKYLLEASPGYSSDTSKRSGIRLKKEEKRIPSERVNTSLLESESVYLPVIYESPPKKRKSNVSDFRPSTAPPQFDLRGITWKDLIFADINGNIPEQNTEISLDKNIAGLSNETELTMKAKQFPPKYGPSDADGIRPKTAPTVATLNGRYSQEEADIQCQTEANLQTDDVALTTSKALAATQSTTGSAYFGIDSTHTSSISVASVSMTAEEALRLLHLAASMIQAYVRGFLQRKNYQRFLKKHKAAITIQAVWRGYYTRNLDMELMSLKKDQNIQKLTDRIGTIEEELARVQVERRKDKAVIAEIVTIMMHEINSQREKINSLGQAKELEEQYRENVHGICIGLQTEICQLRTILDQKLQLHPSELLSHQLPHSKASVITSRTEVSEKLKCSDLPSTQPETILVKPDSVVIETGVSRADKSNVGTDSSEQTVGRSHPIVRDSCEPTTGQFRPVKSNGGVESRIKGGINHVDRSNVRTDSSENVVGTSHHLDTDSCEPTVGQSHPAAATAGVESRKKGGMNPVDRSDVRRTDSSENVVGRSRPINSDDCEPTVGQSQVNTPDSQDRATESAEFRYSDDDGNCFAAHDAVKSRLQLEKNVGSTDIESTGVSGIYTPFETAENRMEVGSSITKKSHPVISCQPTDKSNPVENFSVGSSQSPSLYEDLGSKEDGTLDGNERTKVSGDSFVPSKMDRDFPVAHDLRKTQLNETFIIGDHEGCWSDKILKETVDAGENDISSVVSGNVTAKGGDSIETARDDIGKDGGVTGNEKAGPGRGRDDTGKSGSGIRLGGANSTMTRPVSSGPTGVARQNEAPSSEVEACTMKRKFTVDSIVASESDIEIETLRSLPKDASRADWKPTLLQNYVGGPKVEARGSLRRYSVKTASNGDKAENVEQEGSVEHGFTDEYDNESETGVRADLKDENKITEARTVSGSRERTVAADLCDETREILAGMSAKAGRTEETGFKQGNRNDFGIQNDTMQILSKTVEIEPAARGHYSGRSEENSTIVPEDTKGTEGELTGRSVTRNNRETLPSVPDNVSTSVLARDLNIASENLSNVFGKTKQRLKDITDRRRTLFPSISTTNSESTDYLSRSLTSTPANETAINVQQKLESREETQKFTQAPRKLFSPLGVCDTMSDLDGVAMANRDPHIAPDDVFSKEKSVMGSLQIDNENSVVDTDVKSGLKGGLGANFENRTPSSGNLNSIDSREPQTGHQTSGPAYSTGKTGPVMIRNQETEAVVDSASGTDTITDDSTQDTLNEMSYESGSAASNVRTSTPVKEDRGRIETNPVSKDDHGKPSSNVRTSTPENKDRIESSPVITDNDATAASRTQKVVMSPSRALHDVPDCLSSMPLIVPQTREQKTPEVSKTLPMFIDQSFDSANTSFDI